MEYNKEKVESAKKLFEEILELNQKLPEDRWIDVELSGGPYPTITVSFWKEQEDGGFFYDDDDSYLKLYFADIKRPGLFESSYTKIAAKLQEWKELYCK